jgi:hypothetical protein
VEKGKGRVRVRVREGVSLICLIYLVGCVFLSEGEFRSMSIEFTLYSDCKVSRKGGCHAVNLSMK